MGGNLNYYLPISVGLVAIAAVGAAAYYALRPTQIDCYIEYAKLAEAENTTKPNQDEYDNESGEDSTDDSDHGASQIAFTAILAFKK